MTSTVGMMWKSNRHVIYMIPAVLVALGGLFYSRTQLTGFSQGIVAISSFGFLALVLISTMWLYKWEAGDYNCLKSDIDGLDDPVCIFFQRGVKMETFPSKITSGLFFTHIYAERKAGTLEDLDQLFPDMAETDDLWIKHWLPWRERWDPGEGSAVWKHVPVPHKAVYRCHLIPSRWKPMEDDEEFKHRRLFEMGFSPNDYKGPNGKAALNAYFRPIWEARTHGEKKQESVTTVTPEAK